MSYEKTNWQTGDTITAEKLNHAEQGIYDNSVSGGILVVEITDDDENFILNKTWNEINNTSFAIAILRSVEINNVARYVWTLNKTEELQNPEGYEGIVYIVQFFTGTNISYFYTLSADGYPSTENPLENSNELA